MWVSGCERAFYYFSKTEQTREAFRGEEQVGTSWDKSKEEKKKRVRGDKEECLRAAAMTMNADDPTVKQVATTGTERG